MIPPSTKLAPLAWMMVWVVLALSGEMALASK